MDTSISMPNRSLCILMSAFTHWHMWDWKSGNNVNNAARVSFESQFLAVHICVFNCG